MKFSTKYGDMFSCGWLPPITEMPEGSIALPPVFAYGVVLAFVAQMAPDGDLIVGELVEPAGTWVCAGNSEIFSV